MRKIVYRFVVLGCTLLLYLGRPSFVYSDYDDWINKIISSLSLGSMVTEVIPKDVVQWSIFGFAFGVLLDIACKGLSDDYEDKGVSPAFGGINRVNQVTNTVNRVNQRTNTVNRTDRETSPISSRHASPRPGVVSKI
ncbi:MAG: hypothetical protein LBF23_00020 [Endomicrobium sp.]|jgi:hypothetical protein|nr:hypothetical protein [Endomicrobium sp.]